MYKTKMELLKKQFREDSCFSALITVGLDSVIAGTPVMASINPFNNVVEPSNKLTFAKAVSLRDDAPDRPGRPRPVGDRYARNNYAPTRPKNTTKWIPQKPMNYYIIVELGPMLCFHLASLRT